MYGRRAQRGTLFGTAPDNFVVPQPIPDEVVTASGKIVSTKPKNLKYDILKHKRDEEREKLRQM